MIRTSSRSRCGARTRLGALGASAAALLFAACGGSGASNGPEPEAALSAPAASVAPDAEVRPPDAPAAPTPAEAKQETVEASVGWVAAHQSRDGRWEVGGWNRWSMGERVSGDGLSGLGSARLDVAATALALLAYTGAGYTVDCDSHVGPVIAWGLHALLYRQDADGAFGDPLEPSWPVNHALAVLALTEIAETRPEPRLVEAVRLAVACYQRSRAAEEDRWTDDRAFGGLPPFAWIAIASDGALRAATLGPDGVRPSATGIDLDPALVRDRARVASWVTLPDAERSVAKVGAGLLLGFRHLEGGKKHPDVVASSAWLAERVPQSNATGEGVDALGWWIATRGLFLVGGEVWKKWEGALKPAVVDTQRKDGTNAELRGSWDPVGAGAAEGGRVVMTLACSLILEIWYRYDKVFGDSGGKPAKAPARVAPAASPRNPALPRRWYPTRK